MSELVRTDESILLSTLELLPYVDLELAMLVGRVALEDLGQKPSDSRVMTAIERLQTMGALEPIRDLLAVPENIQAIARESMVPPSKNVALAAARLFALHAEASMKDGLIRLLGTRGAELLALTYAAVGRPDGSDDRTASDALAHYLFAARGYGRRADVAAAADILSRFEDPASRVVRFIAGTEAWNDGDHAKAITILSELTDRHSIDAVSGLSRLLIGVHESSLHNWDTAIGVVRDAEIAFAGRGDRRGQSKALVSLGRILFERSLLAGGGAEEAVLSFTKAIDLAEELIDEQGADALQTVGQAEIGLSRILRERGDFIGAIGRADSALRRFATNSNQWRSALQNLIDVVRSSGQFRTELRAAGVPEDGLLPDGPAAMAVGTALVAKLPSSGKASPGENLASRVDRTEAVNQFLEKHAEYAFVASARAELTLSLQAFHESESRSEHLLARIASLTQRLAEGDDTAKEELEDVSRAHRAITQKMKSTETRL